MRLRKEKHSARLDLRVLPAEMNDKFMFQRIPMRNGKRVTGIRSQLMSLEIKPVPLDKGCARFVEKTNPYAPHVSRSKYSGYYQAW